MKYTTNQELFIDKGFMVSKVSWPSLAVPARQNECTKGGSSMECSLLPGSCAPFVSKTGLLMHIFVCAEGTEALQGEAVHKTLQGSMQKCLEKMYIGWKWNLQ